MPGARPVIAVIITFRKSIKTHYIVGPVLIGQAGKETSYNIFLYAISLFIFNHFLFKNFTLQLLESDQSSNVSLMSTSPNKRNRRRP